MKSSHLKSLAVVLTSGLLAGCGSDDAPEQADGYASRTDGRGWAVSDEGLFGHRRPSAEPARDPLRGIGYAQGSEAAPASTGVLIHSASANAGVNLLHSGDAAEAALMDNDGQILHRWAVPYGSLDDAPPLDTPFQIPWRRVHLRPDGSLLAIHSDAALVHLDRDSKVRWTLFDRVHHDLDCLEGPGGPRIFALSRTERVVAFVNPSEPILDDLVIEISAEGEIVRTLSLWDAFQASPWAEMLGRLTDPTGDAMHANSLDVLDASEAAAFADAGGQNAVQPGDLLVCMRDLDLVTVVNLKTKALVWLSSGPSLRPWRGPHDPTLTKSGEILIFDNLGGRGGHSRVLRWAPSAESFDWIWQGDPPESFSSQYCGTVQELPSGHVLATESCHGRAIEIDPASGDIVWEFVSDRVAGEDDELVAALLEVERMPRPKWLKPQAASQSK